MYTSGIMALLFISRIIRAVLREKARSSGVLHPKLGRTISAVAAGQQISGLSGSMAFRPVARRTSNMTGAACGSLTCVVGRAGIVRSLAERMPNWFMGKSGKPTAEQMELLAFVTLQHL